MKITVAVVQYDVPLGVDESFKKLEEMVVKSVEMGAQLVVAPETAVGSSEEVAKTGVDYLPRLSDLVKKHGVFLSTSYYKQEEGHFYDQGYILNPKGEVAVEHRKIYPAKSEVDEMGLVSGNSLGMGKTEIGNLGMVICKDGFNRYSHFLYEKFGEAKADIICAATWSLGWKKTLGVSNEEYVKAFYVYGAFLSRAFVLLSGNINKETESFGRSMIISPLKGVVKEASNDKEEILVETIDLNEVKKVREFDEWWQPKERVI